MTSRLSRWDWPTDVLTGDPAPWFVPAFAHLGWHDGTVYDRQYVHRNSVADEPFRRAIVEHVRGDALKEWGWRWPGHGPPPRVRFHFGPTGGKDALLLEVVCPAPHDRTKPCSACIHAIAVGRARS